MFIGHYKLKEKDFVFSKSSWKWLGLLCLGAIFGFLIKVVFVVPMAVLAFDFALDKKIFSDKKKMIKSTLYAVSGVVFLALVLILSKFIFPFFKLDYALKYWEHFVNFGGRDWFQIFIQFIKSILYTSPLLLLPVFFMDKKVFKKTRLFLLFLLVEIIFYLVIFDFSTGALDRYLQFMIVPLCVISGIVISRIISSGDKKRNKEYTLLGVSLALIIFLSVFVPHFVPSLYPKSAWLSRIFSLKWNFLYPFFGGSGPLGFYISFLFMALSWILSIGLIIFGLAKSDLKKMVLIVLIPIGFMYNFVFIEEYLFGGINGSAPKVLSGAVEFIKNNPNIKFVTVYNDNGGYDIQSIGKYRKRLYIDPKFDINDKISTLNQYKEHYLVIDIPKIDPTSIYQKYLDS
jgi:hypothetical protein